MAGANDANVWIGFNLGTGTPSQANWVDVTGSNTVVPLRPVLGIALDPIVSAANLPVGYAAVGGFNANTPPRLAMFSGSPALRTAARSRRQIRPVTFRISP